MAFAPGDIVALKSGGHSMTVVAIEAEDVNCLWVNDAGELFRQSIPAIALTMIEQSESDEDEAEEEHEDEDEEDDEDREKRRKKG
ncbi:MAG: DUF2158 domain-containing protein [Xanthobacteraceae bacterium]|jgi:uncharacterized protein YodC (DUF2158 family)